MEMRPFGAKKALIEAVLRQLGHKIPDDKMLQDIVAEAVRQVKASSGLDPGPAVRLVLVPLAGNQVTAQKTK
jgi:hypothetical protein